MENNAIVVWRPLDRASGQTNEISNSLRRLILEQAALDSAQSGFNLDEEITLALDVNCGRIKKLAHG